MSRDPYLTKTGAVALMAYRRFPMMGKNQLWLMRLADDSMVRVDDELTGDNDDTWAAVKDAMRKLAADVSVQTVKLPDGSEVVRDDSESM
jgi:hypothetical protein